MTLIRRFLVVQTLMLWQGGFLFYSAFVVPTGTEVLGSSFEQGRITRFVADSLNWVGATALLVFGWDLLQAAHPTVHRKWLFGCWLTMAIALAGLFAIHPKLLQLVDFETSTFEDRSHFRFWHRTYLWICTVQWAAGLVYAWALLSSWRKADGIACRNPE